jgi:hypothetical protein
MPGRFIMAGLALFIVWTLVRAWRTSVIRDGIWTFDADDNPIMYAVAFGVRIGLVIFLAGCAAGYPPSEVADALGIGWMNSLHQTLRHT